MPFSKRTAAKEVLLVKMLSPNAMDGEQFFSRKKLRKVFDLYSALIAF
jgi:hypothetical protein